MTTKKVNADYGKIDFVGKVKFFGGISVIMVVAAVLYLAVNGVKWGIDFAGGSELQVKFAQPVPADVVRKLAEDKGLAGVGVQSFGDESEYIIRFQTEKGATDKETNEKTQAAINILKDGITKDLADKQPDIRRVDSVGPQVGAELKRNGLLSVFYCLLVILIYVALRFDYSFAPGAVICLAHDAVITFAIFVALGKEVNVPIVAAILTLIGYSLNDTIVVFDRIRETGGNHSGKSLALIINKSINDMLERTLITSGIVFTSSLALYWIAGGVVSDIAFAITVGTAFGTYSSVYVAAPMIMLMEKLKVLKTAEA